MIDLIKKIIKEIQKLEQQKQLKIEKRNQLDKEINIINLRLKDLNNLKNQYEKLEKNTDSFFENMASCKRKGQVICPVLFGAPAASGRSVPPEYPAGLGAICPGYRLSSGHSHSLGRL